MAELTYPAKTAYQSKQAAETYDQRRFKSLKGKWLDAREKRIIGELLEYLPQGSQILDLACGTGRIAEFLLSRDYEVCGVDISQEMLKVAKERLSNFGELIEFQQADAERLPFEEKRFDSATCFRLFGHIPPETRVKILKEMKRVTKGPFIAAYYLSEPIANIKRKVRKFLNGDKSLWFPVSRKNLREELSQVNLRIVEEKSLMRYLSETLILLLDRGPK
jgi:ubiquinone/menaquinone biosynthesis C-methylase UbiE